MKTTFNQKFTDRVCKLKYHETSEGIKASSYGCRRGKMIICINYYYVKSQKLLAKKLLIVKIYITFRKNKTAMYILKIYSRLLGVIFLCLTICGSAEAQLKKGDYQLDVRLSNAFSIDLFEEPNYTLNLDLLYLRMVNDRFMVGGSFSYNFTNSVFSDGSTETISLNSYQVSQITRYYFATGRFAPFASLENRFNLLSVSGFDNSLFGYRLRPGLGFDYFIRPNIALEGLFSTNLITQGDFDILPNTLIFDLGLKLFFNGKFFKKITALPERILRKGNIISTTRLSYVKVLEDGNRRRFNFTPNIRYFLTDRFNIFGQYAHQRTSSGNGFNDLNLSLGAGYFLGLSNHLFLNFEFTSTIEGEGIEFFDVFDDVFLFTNTLSTSLHYFSGSTKFYGGIGYTDRAGSIFDDITNLGYTFEVFTGVDYYVSDYLFLNGDLRFSNLGFNGLIKSGQKVELDFGLGFIIGKRGFEEAEEKLKLKL